jgi:hypothetical protein
MQLCEAESGGAILWLPKPKVAGSRPVVRFAQIAQRVGIFLWIGWRRGLTWRSPCTASGYRLLQSDEVVALSRAPLRALR